MGFGPSLYSIELYSQNLYSGAPGTVMLSETLAPADALTLNAAVALLEALVVSDAPLTANTLRVFNEILSLFDNSAASGQNVLTDFVLLNEFISPRLQRIVTEWTQRSGQSPGTALVLYSRPLYAQNIYSGTSPITWKAIALSTGPGFTNFDGHKN